MKLDVCTVISLNVIRFNTQPKTISVPPRQYHSLSFRISGKNVITAEGENYDSGSGDITFMPCGMKYVHRVLTTSKTIALHFATKGSIGEKPQVFRGLPAPQAGAFFDGIYNAWKQSPVENSLASMAGFYRLLQFLSENDSSEDSGNPSPGFMKEALSTIYARFRDSEFQVGDLHTKAFVSETHFRRVFKKAHGCSPSEFLRRLRINHAKELLKTGCHTAAEAAELSGFSSPSYFSFAFREATGFTPKEIFAKTFK